MNDPAFSPIGPPVEPNILIPKTVGLLHVIFAVGLMGCGMCYAFYSSLLPSLGKVIEAEQKARRNEKAIASKADIEALKVQEAQAATEDEKAAIRARMEAISNVPPAPVVDFGFKNFGFDDPRVLGYFICDAASGMILNLVMFVAGIGLLRRGEWARKLGVGLGWTKIFRLALLSCWLLLIARPIMLSHGEAFLQGLEKPGANGPPEMTPKVVREILTGIDQLTFTFSLVTLLAGSIYPVLSIVLLTRPSARAACRPRPKSEHPSQDS